MTRGKARAGGAKRTVVEIIQSAAHQGEGLLRAALTFEAALAVERKRRVNDKLTAMAATITELMEAQEQMAESQKVFMEGGKALVDSNRTMMETIKAQAEEIMALKALVQESSRPRSYSGAVVGQSAAEGVNVAQKQYPVSEGKQVQRGRPQVSRRISPCHRHGQVQRRKEQLHRHRRLPPSRTHDQQGHRKAEQCSPVKCDSVAKQCVLDEVVDDGKTLKKDFLKGFKANNGSEEADCTVMKATWLSKGNAAKKVGSLKVWLKNKVGEDHLLRAGTAVFGAMGAFCSPFVVGENSGPCYRCNRYAHKQASCTSHARCAICSKGHRRDECTNKDDPRCPACNDAHTVFDWTCKLHPQHYRRVGQQKSKARQEQHGAAADVGMDGTTHSSPSC